MHTVSHLVSAHSLFKKIPLERGKSMERRKRDDGGTPSGARRWWYELVLLTDSNAYA